MKKFIRDQIRRLIASARKRIAAYLGGSDKPGDKHPSIHAIRFLGPSIAGWQETTTLHAYKQGASLMLRYDKADIWPEATSRATDGGPLVGNVWVVVQVDGEWLCDTWDWMRPGQQSKALASVRGTDGHIQRPPLSTWIPRSGHAYGFIVSTPARAGVETIMERSQISWVDW